MTEKNTDLTFFTNEQGRNLLDRFKTTLIDTKLFDVLVGYFSPSLTTNFKAVRRIRGSNPP